MTRVGGPADARPAGSAERRNAEKPPEQGEFDRVLDERDAGGDAAATQPQPGGTLRRSLRGPGGGGGGAGSPGGGGAGGDQQPGGAQLPGSGAAALKRGGGQPGQLDAAARQGALAGEGAAAGFSGLPAGKPGRQAGAGAPGNVMLPGAGAPEAAAGNAATEGEFPATSAATSSAGAGAEGTPALGLAGHPGAKGHDPELPPAGDRLPDDDVAAAAERPGGELPAFAFPVAQLATPVAPVAEAPPPAPASDPALVRQVAQQVLAGIEVHQVAGRTQVELGLDLGALGQAKVELSRLPDQGVKLVFRLDTADAQLAVGKNLDQLVHALEQKGMAPQIELQRGDGSPLGDGRGGQQQQPGQDQRQGRSRGEYVPPVEEER